LLQLRDRPVVVLLADGRVRRRRLSATTVVTVESLDGTGDPDEALDLTREGMLELPGADVDLDVTGHLQCGQPAETIQYAAAVGVMSMRRI